MPVKGRAEAANVEGEQARPRAHATKLGKYQLLAVLGRGGMAEVFLALSRGQMGFDKLAVVKRLREGLAEDESFRSMFLDEARLAARLNHPNVVHTYEVGEHDGTYYIAMEYLEGQALNKVMNEGQKLGTHLSAPVCARIISDALAGLHHAHTLTDFDGRPLGIIHRDISPHNLFVTYEGTTKVVDFGIAKAALSSSETEVGVLKGKVAYMSPEQATGAPIDARSDVFAMGIVLWEMLTQRRLMTGDSAASTIHRLLTAPVPPASSLRREIAPSLDAIVERALEKNPDDRFSSALDMRDAIEAYLATLPKAPRTEEIGRQVGEMFVSVREAIKRQIQEHVEGAGKASDSEVRSSSAVRAREGTQVSQELPLLSTGSGSARIPGLASSSGVVSRQAPPVEIVEVPAPARSAPAYSPAYSAPSAPAPSAPASSSLSPFAAAPFSAPPFSAPAFSAPPSSVVPSGPAPSSAMAGPGSSTTAPARTGVSATTLTVVGVLLLAAVVGTSVATQVVLQKAPQPAPVTTVTQFTDPATTPAAPGAMPLASTGASAGVTPGASGAHPVDHGAVPGALPGALPVPAPATGKGTHKGHVASSAATPVAPVTAPAAPAAPAAPGADGVGYVTFDTYPWTRVTEGGTSLGTTPLVHVPLSPGVHTLTLDNPEQSIHETYVITLKGGESVSKRLAFK